MGLEASAVFYGSQPDRSYYADPDQGPVGFAFWYAPQKDHLYLPEVDAMGLSTAKSRGGFARVVLLTYQQLQGVPSEVEVQDANQYVPEEKFQYGLQQQKLPIPLLSDWVRLEALKQHGQQTRRSEFKLQDHICSCVRVKYLFVVIHFNVTLYQCK